MNIINYLTKHEGLKLNPYRCTAGKLTIGIGRNLEDKGITPEEALYLLTNDIKECEADLRTIFPAWDLMTPNRRMVLIDMRFQLGHDGFRKFKATIQAVKDKNWGKVCSQIKASLYYEQVPLRAKENIRLMEEG